MKLVQSANRHQLFRTASQSKGPHDELRICPRQGEQIQGLAYFVEQNFYTSPAMEFYFQREQNFLFLFYLPLDYCFDVVVPEGQILSIIGGSQ